MEDKDKFVPMGTKVSPEMAQVFNACCDALETDTYHLLQGFIESVIRAASKWHRKTPTVDRLLNMIDLDVGWQKRINLCAPNGKYTISQMILIIEQEGAEGFEAVMLDKPFMGECKQTENVDKMFENLCEVIYRKTYRRFRKLAALCNTQNQRQMFEMLIDNYVDNMEAEADREAMEGVNDFADNNKRYEYGKRTKRVKRRTPDEFIQQGELNFEQNQEREENAAEARHWLTSEEARQWLEDNSDYKPFCTEW